jgi:ribosome-associated translation inhibitor RaiA
MRCQEPVESNGAATMKYTDLSERPHVEVATENMELSDVQWHWMQKRLPLLQTVVSDFPKSDLCINAARHARNCDFHVKASLVLPGRTLCTGESGQDVCSCFARAIRKLVMRVQDYKCELDHDADTSKHRKATRRDIVPSEVLNLNDVKRAIDAQDYAAFRRLIWTYEEPVRKRAGRWVQRYPRAQAALETEFQLADIVEEVFLMAFERFEQKPADLRFGDWLEMLIDPAVRALLQNPDDELRAVEFARTIQEFDVPQSLLP